MRRFQKFLSPIMFFGHAAKRAAAACPLVVSVVVMVVLAVGASGGVALAQAGTSAPTPSAGWPQLHYGPGRTGYQPNETRIGTGNVSQLAQVRTYHAAAYLSAPLIANGVLYVDTGKLYAFDATGATKCSTAPVTCTPLWTAPTAYFDGMTIANGDVYVTDGEGVQAFDAAGSKNCSGTPKVCAPLWTAATSNSPTYSAPAVANGTVYVGSWNSKLYAFNAAGSTNCSTSATGKTCRPLWTATTPTSIGGTPAVANGVVYTVSGNGTLSAFNAAGSTNCSGTVTAKTCTPLWRSAPGTSGYATSSSPAVANGVVYFSSTNGGTYGYDAAGSLNCSVSGTAKTCSPLWGAVTSFTGGGSPAIVNGVLYINVSGNGTIYAYSLTA